MQSILIGIAGGSGSGKTTLASGLKGMAARYGCAVIAQDHYYKSLHESADPHRHSFDHPDSVDLSLLTQHLADLKRSRPVQIPIYDYKAHRRTEQTQVIAPCPLVIAEGLFVLASEELRNLFDLKVFVKTPRHLRLSRRIERDTVSRGRSKSEVVARFENDVEPMFLRYTLPTAQFADVVIEDDGSGNSAISAQLSEMWTMITRLLDQPSSDPGLS